MAGFNPSRLKSVLDRHDAKLRIAIETGVFHASTTRQLARLFEQVHGIELSDMYYETATKTCKPFSNITIHHGDSALVLPVLGEQLQEPVLFYLDAHWFDFSQVADSAPFPLWQEMEYIKGRKHPDIIVVDDAHTFGKAVGHVQEWVDLSMEALVQSLGAETVADSDQVYDWGVIWRKDRR